VARTVECFYPGSSFPAVSVTGGSCSLDCRHCSRKYLEGMVPATAPEELLEVAEALAERGAKGFLLSGGADDKGKVPLYRFADAIREIKSTTDLKVNAHVGLTPRRELAALVGAGVDAFSVDVYGSDETVREVLGLSAGVEDYMSVISDLKELGAPIVAPHICIGIHGGEVKGEFRAVERLQKLAPRELVLISLIPTSGTAYADRSAPDKGSVLSVIRHARTALPDTKLLLGCMRSKRNRSWEIEFVEAGLDGIVLPAASTVERLKDEGFSVRKRAVCCAIP